MSDYDKNTKLMMYNSNKLDKVTTWILFLYFGWSYGSMDQMVKQVFYYLTLGGFGFWALYVLFTLNSKVKKYNRDLAIRMGLDTSDLVMLGLN